MTDTKLLDEYCGLIKTAGGKINATDVLIVVDMQIDFLPGGKLGVTEGDSTIPGIKKLISGFAAKNAPVFFTRDYHPINHCSFTTKGGPFNPHCIQGSEGAKFTPELTEVAQPLLKEGKVGVLYKGFCDAIDSFGAFPYSDETIKSGRVSNSAPESCGCKSQCWTGAFCLFASSVEEDMNAPPDVMAILNKIEFDDAIQSKIKDKATARVFVVGLTLDFCVVDTAINETEAAGYKDVSIITDCSRSVHIGPGGPVGSGFVSPADDFVKRTEKAGVKLVTSDVVKL